MTLQAFTRANVRSFSDEVTATLEALAKKHGVSVTRGTGRFSDRQYTVKLQFDIVNLAEKSSFELHARSLGLAPTDFGREFISQGTVYKIVGVRPRRRKFPVLCENMRTGKQILFTEGGVKQGLMLSSGVLPKPASVAPMSMPKTGLTPEIKSKFEGLAGRLSPENLCCDGEISGAQVVARKRQIMAEWAALELQAGVRVSEDEVWGWRR